MSYGQWLFEGNSVSIDIKALRAIIALQFQQQIANSEKPLAKSKIQ